MTGYHKTITLQLDTADADGVAEAQTLAGAGDLDLDGILVSGGVATFDVARRVLITSAADDSDITFTVTGTDRYGRAQTEVVTGGNAAAVYSDKDFLTVSQVTASAATSGDVEVGTNAVGSSAPLVVDRFVNPAKYSYSLDNTGTVTNMIQVCYDDLAPAWDVNANEPVWKDYNNNSMDVIEGPVTMIRLTNLTGDGTSRLQIITPFTAGRV